ncbi:MAG: 23S rRNA (guanosine(2251)-2'-O)-methyltransferase RlmB [Pseudomonadota bacterium]
MNPADSRQPEIVAGVNPVLEALRSRPERCNELIVAKGKRLARLEEILDLARRSGVRTRFEPPAALDRLAKGLVHQGVVALFAPRGYIELEDLLDLALTRRPALLLVLDGITDPHNLGAAARSAEAAGALGLVLPKDRAAPVTAAAQKAAAGALEYLAVARVTNLVRALEMMKKAGLWVAGTTLEGGVSVYEADLTVDLALVIGREDKGLRHEVAKACDLLLTIPMLGRTQSLNAAQAATVVLFETLRQRAGRGGRTASQTPAGGRAASQTPAGGRAASQTPAPMTIGKDRKG